MAQTAGPQRIVYLHCSSILCLLYCRNALVYTFFNLVDISVEENDEDKLLIGRLYLFSNKDDF